jgi:threonine dehydratase
LSRVTKDYATTIRQTYAFADHGAAVAYAAKLLNVSAKIFLPINANPTKQARIRARGAEIIEHGKDISEAFEAAREYVGRRGGFLLNDATNPDVTVGTATIGAEIIEQLPDVTQIWVPVGDTVLIHGIASAAKHLRPKSVLLASRRSARLDTICRGSAAAPFPPIPATRLPTDSRRELLSRKTSLPSANWLMTFD